jgi:hypothetical protein
VYTAWQQRDDPTRFVHLFEFADDFDLYVPDVR